MPNHSCQTQLILLVEDILKAMDSHHQIDLILLDFAKAFDTVPHKRLLTKLHYYSIYSSLHDWIKVWLTRRYQKVIIEGESSRSLFRCPTRHCFESINVPNLHK